MPITSHHIIRKQYLHVEANGTDSDGLSLQRSLPALCRDWLVPAIERVLERCAPADGHLYIERLEIDAGTLTLERLEHDIAESVAQALERSLREQIPPQQLSPTIVSSNIQHKTARQSVNEAFIYFLTTGSLPWSFRLPEGRNLEQVIVDSWQDAAKLGIDDYLTKDAVRRALVSETVRKRLIQQFSLGFLEALLSLLSLEGQKVMDRISHVMRSVDDSIVDKKYFERHLWETAFGSIAERKLLTPAYLVSETCRSLPSTFVLQSALSRVLERHWPAVIDSALAAETRFQQGESTTPKKAEPKYQNTEFRPPNNVDPTPHYFAISKNAPVKMSEHPQAQEGIYIENAGLVLLSPFLPQFFTALGIVAEDKLLQPERALGLLHFVTTGQPIAPEYALVLPKILCNIPLGTAVESDLQLTNLEKDESVALLEAVIHHWEALGNTSPDGLRGTFLLRPGKVSLRDDGDWLLQVESNGFDILLDQLPWGFSTIKLPWMNTILWVEWT